MSTVGHTHHKEVPSLISCIQLGQHPPCESSCESSNHNKITIKSMKAIKQSTVTAQQSIESIKLNLHRLCP